LKLKNAGQITEDLSVISAKDIGNNTTYTFGKNISDTYSLKILAIIRTHL